MIRYAMYILYEILKVFVTENNINFLKNYLDQFYFMVVWVTYVIILRIKYRYKGAKNLIYQG